MTVKELYYGDKNYKADDISQRLFGILCYYRNYVQVAHQLDVATVLSEIG